MIPLTKALVKVVLTAELLLQKTETFPHHSFVNQALDEMEKYYNFLQLPLRRYNWTVILGNIDRSLACRELSH